MIAKSHVPWFMALALVLGGGQALAQAIGTEEAVKADGAVNQVLALTPAQQHAIYSAVIQHRVRASPAEIPVAIGAVVPQAVELGDLPDDATTDNPQAVLLKYAIVEDAVVVVDPITMRVVGVIDDNAGR